MAARARHSNEYSLVDAYRKYGHLKADVNPVYANKQVVPELEPTQYGVSPSLDPSAGSVLYSQENYASLDQLTNSLKQLYCGPVGIEFMHLPTAAEREWFAREIESGTLLEPFTDDEKIHMLKLLLKSKCLDVFLSSKFPSVKRYSGEGAEALMCFYFYTFGTLAQSGVPHVAVGMAHRGRLNLLTGLLELPLAALFSKMLGRAEFSEEFLFTGDTLMHMSYTRALHRRRGVGQYTAPPRCSATSCETVLSGAPSSSAPVALLGVLQETLMMTSVPHFSVGGALHVVVNNQIGFTTEAAGRASDVALVSRVPIISVNGEQPEAVARAARLAVLYQQRFGRDVFVDVLCWRHHGHNELDNPRLTNPRMYNIVDAKTFVYAAALVQQQVITEAQVTEYTRDVTEEMTRCYEKAQSYSPPASIIHSRWDGLTQSPQSCVEVWDTGVPTDTLKFVAAKSVEIPPAFNVHPHLLRTHVAGRLKRLNDSAAALDWATAEAMALGSILLQGVGVRLSGQDVGRGTFAHRNCQLVDQTTEARYEPLNHLTDDQTAYLEVANSILSEEAVLGFEYGMSINNKDVLHLWEAQFGDFFNGAQTVIDAFISSGESKWLYQSGLVLMLPHGFDGAGPEHSSCRIERFLTDSQSAEHIADSSGTNWTVATPTTPAQYFHLLRQQIVRPYRKPLIIVAPKTMLRMPAATSHISHMAPGTHFLPVIDDASVRESDGVRRVVFVSGKHFYALADERAKRGISDTALVRVESLCPFPAHELHHVLKKYSKAKKLVWAQEEPRNMGAWPFVFPRFLNICGAKVSFY
ncbi:hypothetical protein HAZT_HAZT008006 [Hyalella azteca]|uniref:Transketolase-like pyrimidine-binding domain-containing protein n=1 Tax=Hyalella azteca TaxID=294128 RepID=A0A6A0HCW1_HYAAZ|nr:hypothetical protein HAZT_HAZT008006 [Hyalella azteca]